MLTRFLLSLCLWISISIILVVPWLLPPKAFAANCLIDQINPTDKTGLTLSIQSTPGQSYVLDVRDEQGNDAPDSPITIQATGSTTEFAFGPYQASRYSVFVTNSLGGGTVCNVSITITKDGGAAFYCHYIDPDKISSCSTDPAGSSKGIDGQSHYATLDSCNSACISGPNVNNTSGGGGGRPVAMPLMECIDGIVQAPNPGKPNTDPAILSTAIGCVPVKDLGLFLQWVLGWLFGAAGAIIVLFLIKLGYDIVTSQGDPQKLQEVKESIISIFSGLILIVFSLVLLKTIGADILGLPGF